MIAICLLFAAIATAEGSYLHRRKRKRSAWYVVFGSIAIMLALSEVLYAEWDRFQLAQWIQAAFGPLERVLLGK